MKKIGGSLWFAIGIYVLILIVVVIPNYQELVNDGSIVIPVLVGMILLSAVAFTTKPTK